jgi:uncharacterized repeat protein (TIGR03803 family)
VIRLQRAPKKFAVLHNFGSEPDNGRIPYGVLVLHKGVLYGTTTYGGPPYDVPPGNDVCKGNLFRMNMDGSGFTVLHNFAGGDHDGWKPWTGLAVANDTIYGSTVYGGPNDQNGGVIYALSTNGNDFRVLHAFGNPGDGFGGSTSPTLVGDTLYGMTRWGGNGTGTIYSYDTISGRYMRLRSFAQDGRDGSYPLGTLTAGEDGFLYGLTWQGGKNDMGTLFRIRPDGTAFGTLHHFSGSSQGKYPYDSPVMDGSHQLYGTTLGAYANDPSDLGVIFKYDLANIAYSVLHRFTGKDGDSGKPNGNIVLSPDGTRLYGTTHGDTVWGGKVSGVLYEMKLDGTGFTALEVFDRKMNGYTPMHTPLLVDGALYGMTAYGGAEDCGVVYRYRISP